MTQPKEVLENEYKSIEKQIGVLESKKEKIEEQYLQLAKFKVGDIVKIKGWSKETYKGWVKEVFVSHYHLTIEYKIGNLKKDGSPDKRRILRYSIIEKDILSLEN